MSSRGLTVVVAVVLVTSGVVGGNTANSIGSTATTSHSDSYVLEQGDVCQPIEPLSTDGTVEEFYDYRSHETHPPGVDRLYSSYGTTHLQEDDTSILFLHEGTDGLSLVMVHDRVDGDSAGGLVTFEIDGLPDGAHWVVRDDEYGGEGSETNIDEFDSGSGWATASWVWREARTDGGAITGGLDGEFALTIHPAFNDEAEFADDAEELTEAGIYDGGVIDGWEVLSGAGDDPERIDLSLEGPVTIRTGTCGDTAVSYDRHGDRATVDVENADVGDPLSFDAMIGSNGVEFDDFELTPTREAFGLEFDATRPETSPDSSEDVESLSALEVTGEGVEPGGTVTFTVETGTLEADGLEPGGVTLYERNETEWVESPTTVHSESDDFYRFVAKVSDVSTIAVGYDLDETDEESVEQRTSGDDDADDLGGPTVVVIPIAVLATLVWIARRGNGDDG